MFKFRVGNELRYLAFILLGVLCVYALFHALFRSPQASVRESIRHERNELTLAQSLANEMQGDAEYLLEDGTRVDILTATHAIEVDWAPKWAESIGQTLFYAEMTGKKPCVILLLNDEKKEQVYVHRLRLAIKRSGCDIKVVTRTTASIK